MQNGRNNIEKKAFNVQMPLYKSGSITGNHRAPLIIVLVRKTAQTINKEIAITFLLKTV